MVLRRVGLDTEEIVKSDILALDFGDFVTKAEDFMVWRKPSANSLQVVATGCTHAPRRISGRKQAIGRRHSWINKIRNSLTFFSPGSGECSEDAQHECKHRVGSHGWGWLWWNCSQVIGSRCSIVVR